MSRFAECLAVILREEGGYVDNPHDHGGATNHGVTQATFDAWRAARNEAAGPVRYITNDEVAAIYQEQFWGPSHASDCAEPLDLVVFDTAVNSGPELAVRTLQRALGVPPDGVVGPVTAARISSCDPKGVAARFLDLREQFYEVLVDRDPSQACFLKGWLSRAQGLRQIVGVA